MRTPVAYAVAVLTMVGRPLAADPAGSARPNVLILFADDQRADTIAALGNPVIKTPNLDRLVRRGVAFDRAAMQAAFNPATGVPSRLMLLTGRSLFSIEGQRANEAKWPAAFGRAGYTRRSGSCGNTTVGRSSPPFPSTRRTIRTSCRPCGCRW